MYQGRVLILDEIAIRLVGRHRRAPRDAFRDHVFEQLRELLRVEVVLDVELARAAEAHDLVRHVLLGREVLDAVERRVAHAVEVLDAVDAEVHVVAGRGLGDGDVHRGRQVFGFCLIDRRRGLVAIERADQFQPVCAAVFRGLDQLPDLVRRLAIHLIGRDEIGQHRIEQDARRDDLVRGALGAPLLRLVEIAAHFARGRHASGQIQIALVLNRNRPDTLFVPVHVRVDDAGHDVFARGVDHHVGVAPAGVGVADPRDDAVLGKDVERPRGGRAVADDDHRVLDEEPPDLLGVNGRFRAAPPGSGFARRAHWSPTRWREAPWPRT